MATSMRNAVELGRQIVTLNHAQRVVWGGRPVAGALVVRAGRPATVSGLSMEPQAMFDQAMAGLRDLIQATGGDAAVVVLSHGVDGDGHYRYVVHHHLRNLRWVVWMNALPGRIGVVGVDPQYRDAQDTPFGLFAASVAHAVAHPALDPEAEHAAQLAIARATAAPAPCPAVDSFESIPSHAARCAHCGHFAHDPRCCLGSPTDPCNCPGAWSHQHV